MNRTINLLSFWLLTCFSLAFATGVYAQETEGYMNVNGVEAEVNEPVSLPIHLTTDVTTWTAYEFLLTLPDGVTLQQDEAGLYLCSLSERHGSAHSVSVTASTDGRYAIVCYSTENQPLSSGSGILLTLTALASERVKGQQLKGSISNISFSEAQGNETVLDDVEFDIHVRYPIIIVNEAAREYGDGNPVFTYSVSGAALRGEPVLVCAATETADIGKYLIHAERGTIENAYYEVINDSLVIAPAPLTVIVEGEYSRYEGEENPEFHLAYSGWKLEDNEQVLTQQPTVTCEANEASPMGEYPITVSGGAAKNYTLIYIGGVLTVLANETTDSVLVTIEVEGAGRIRVGATEVEEDMREVRVPKGRQTILEVLPDDGYQLVKLTVGDTDVTEAVEDNRYVIQNIASDTTVYAIFMEDIETFVVDGIRYGVTNLAGGEVKVIAGDYAGSLNIPSTVTHESRAWQVTGLDARALRGCPWLVSVSVPQSVTMVGQDLFKKDHRLAAIRWEAPVRMDRQVMGDFTNPNLLLYVADSQYAPAAVQNIIVNGVADRIVLTDLAGDGNCDFFCPETFTARHISYQHAYTQQTLRGKSQGWETLALPFDVQAVNHERQGVIHPFAALTEDAIDAGARPFWLYTYTDGDTYARAEAVKAYTPFIISMPNDPSYEAEYILGGLVTFSAENVTVAATPDTEAMTTGTQRLFTPCFTRESNGQNLLCINSYEPYAVKAEGSVFVRNLRAARPFEAYFRFADGGAVKEWFSVFDETTGIEDAPYNPPVGDERSNRKWYDLSGREIVKAPYNPPVGDKMANGKLPRGVYICNGKKVISSK